MGAVHTIKWLVEDSPHQETMLGSDRKKTALPYSPEIGSGFTEHIDLHDGITLIQTRHFFTGEDRPEEIELGNFSVKFSTPMFFFLITHSGLKKIKSNIHNKIIESYSGEVIFVRESEYDLVETIYTEEDLSTTVCIIPEVSLNNLLGVENVQILFQNLGIGAEGKYALMKIPESITKKLENSSPDHLEGPIRSLFAQSNLLQFLVELNLFTTNTATFIKELEKDSFDVENLHSELLQIKANIPNLYELAKKYGVSPRKLNQAFVKKYNESIYSFLSNQRLEQAHQALTLSEIPLKTLAHNIGYSHVNHFITAFKKKYGVTPGSLRKKYRII
jgi:AraC-like DNA-binding protein